MSEKKDFIHFHRADIGENEINEVIDTLKSGWITTGPKTKMFEKMFAEYTGAPHAVALNSCTAGLHLALCAAKIKQNDEVITTPITFPATINVILHMQAKPVFCDISLDNLNMAAEKIERLITKKTKAIIPVHFAGHPCDMDKIMDIAKKHNLVVIEDAAHALESEYKGKKVGTIGDFTSFSFYATKNITTGEGGMLTTNRGDLIEKIRTLSLHGISKDAWKRYGDDGFKHWEHLYPGFKYNMFDIQAAIGIHQLKKADAFLQKRRQYVSIYNNAFSNIKEVTLLKMSDKILHAHHLYVLMLNIDKLKIDRDTFLAEMQKQNIGMGVHFRTLHTQPFYLNMFKKCSLPNALFASDRIISLPLYPKMTENDMSRIIEVFCDTIKRFRT